MQTGPHETVAVQETMLRVGRPPLLSNPVRRQRLLEAAEQEFLKNGYAATTVGAIAAAAGMSKRTLYQLFASKQAMFDALLCNRFYQLPVPPECEGDSQEKRLSDLVLSIAAILLHPDRTALVRLIIADAHVSPELLTAFERLEIGRDLTELEDWIGREVWQGRLLVDNVPEAARLLFGMTVAGPILSNLIKAPRTDCASNEERIRLAVRIFLHGLQPPGAPMPAGPIVHQIA